MYFVGLNCKNQTKAGGFVAANSSRYRGWPDDGTWSRRWRIGSGFGPVEFCVPISVFQSALPRAPTNQYPSHHASPQVVVGRGAFVARRPRARIEKHFVSLFP